MQTELKRTALAVRIWRKEHTGPMADMPVDLQREVVKLLESHSWDDVCEAIGIGKSSLSILRRRHQEHLQLRPRHQPRRRRSPSRKRGGRKRPSQRRPTEFIEVPIASGASSRLHVELKLPSGIVLHAHSNTDTSAVGDFVARLLADTQSAG